MAKGNVITRKEIIEDEALKWGADYAKQLQIAIDKNEQFKKGILDIVNAQKGIKGASNNKTYLEEKEKERLAFIKNMNAIREQEAAEKSLIKIRQEALREAKLQLDIKAKEQRARKQNTTQTIEERVAQQAQNKELRRAAMEKLGLIGAYQKLNKQRTDAGRKLRDLIASEQASNKEIEKAQKQFDKLDAKVRRADKAVGDFTKNVGNYPTIGKLSASIKDLFGAFGLVAGVGAVATVLKGAYKTVKEFNQSIADLRAITGASGKDLEFFKKQAIDLGRETKGGAKAVVEAYKLIASAKPELLDNASALNSVTKAAITLSQASGLELPDAATRLTDAMNQMGADASQASEFIDKLANGAKYGAAEIPDITDALLKFGTQAKSSNISIAESTALIELLAEKGLKGAEAGTKLRNVLLKLSAPDALPVEAQQYLEKMGISMETLKDKSLPVQERLEALKPILENDAAAVKVFGAENVVAAKSVLENTDRLKELTSQMGDVGTAAEQAEIRMDTLEGKTEKLTSTYDSFILSIDEGSGVISGAVKIFVEGLTNGLNLLIRLNSSWDELYEKANTQGKEIGKDGYKTLDKGLLQLIEDRKRLTQALEDYKVKLEEAKKSEEKMGAFGTVLGDGGIKESIEKYSGFLGQIEGALEKNQAAIDKIRQDGIERRKKADQDEIDAEKEKTKVTEEELRKREKARQDYLKRLQKLDKDASALALFRLEQEKEISQELSENEKEEIDNRIEAYLYANQLEIAIAQESATQKLKEISRYTDEVRDLTDKEIQTLLNGGEIKKKLTDDEILVLEQYAAKQKEIDDNLLENKQKIVDSIVALEKKKVDATLLNQDTQQNTDLLDENTKFQDELDALGDNHKAIEEATIAHEERVLEIKKRYIQKALEEEIKSAEALLANANISAEKRAEIENKLSQLKLQLNQIEVDSSIEKNEKKLLSEEEYAEQVRDMSEQLVGALADLTNALFDARIQNIDNDIQKNEEYYARQIELAGNDQRQKDLLEQEAERKRKELEKKKRKEQHKQAVFNKALNITEIGLKTAQAIVAALAVGPPQGYVFAALSGALGAAQLAAALATPIPKYKYGRKGGKAEFAEVGDGFIHEVIEKKDGTAYLTPNFPTLTYLEEGDKVHSSVDDYASLQKAAMMSSLASQGKQMSDYEAMKLFDSHYSKELVNEMKLTRKAIEKQKTPAIINNTPDIDHELWKMHFGKFSS